MRLIKAPLPQAVSDGPREKRVLALCGDTQVGMWMVRSLGRNGLTVFSGCRSENAQAAHSKYSSGAWIIDKSPSQDGFVDELEQLARDLDVGSIMTISEGYHDTLITSRERFEPDIHLFCPSRDCFDKATDKAFMHSLCVELGVPVAEGTTLDEILAPGEMRLKFPLVLRTSKQHDSSAGGYAPWKAAYASNEDELAGLAKGLEGFARNILVQEYHPGAEDHIQILMHQGEAYMVGEYIGEHHMPLAGGVTVQRVSCTHPDLEDDAIKVLKAIGWEGIAGVQFHYDPSTDKYIFLEINPRFIGGLPTVIMAGFEAPFLYWQSHFEPERMTKGKYTLGLRSRIPGGDANWMLGMMRGDQLPPGQERLGKLSAAFRFMWNCGPWTRSDVFSLVDMKPAWVDLKHMLRRLGSKSHDIIGNVESQENTR